MKITRLEYQKKDPNRVNVYVDGKFVAGVSVNDVVKLGLYKDQEVFSEQLAKIIGESEFGKLFNFALKFLSYRPRSEWEIRQHLNRKIKMKKEEIRKKEDIDTELKMSEQVIDKLRNIGQINDSEFAKWYIDQRRHFRPMGLSRIRYELIKKGVAKDIFVKLLHSYITDEDMEKISEYELAVRAIKKRFGKNSTMKQFNNEIIPKVQRFLASRGFSWETIKEVVDKIFKQEYNDEEVN